MRDVRPLRLVGVAPLLQTKLLVPRRLSGLVSRPRIHAFLDQGQQVALTLVTAPAGFGKTTAVAEWIRARGIPAAWLSLDASDNDPVRFWRYVVASIAGLRPGFAGGFSAVLDASTNPPWETGLSVLIEDLAGLAHGVTLVLDDYHLIDEPTVHEGISFLLRYAPLQLHLVVVGRTEPPVPQLPRLWAAGRVVQMTELDLRFVAGEQEVFCRQCDIQLSAAELEQLDARTGGWAAGMQMFVLSLRADSDRAGAIDRFQGSDRRLSDYFMEEVFDDLPEAEREFLLLTSVLGRLSGPLCNWLTGREDGSAILVRLARRNAFLACVDETEGWYVCHQLYAEFLRGLLAQRHPGLAADLQRSAAQWCETRGYLTEAVEYYLRGGHHDQAVRLIEQLAVELLGRGETATLVRWLRAVPSGLLDARPHLAIMLAWAAVAGGRLTEVEFWLAAAVPQNVVPPGQDATGNLELDRAMLKMILAVGRLDLPTVLHWLAEAGRGQGEVSVLAQGLAFETSEPSLVGSPWGWYGHLHHVQQSLERGVYIALKGLGSPTAQRGYTFVLLGEVLYEWNRLDDALRSVAQGLEEAERTGDAVSLVPAFFTLARIHLARGDFEAALAVTQQAEKEVRQLGRQAWLPVVAALRARLHLAGGDLAAVDAWQERSRLDVYDRLSAARVYEHITLARVLLARNRGEEAVLFLERLLAFAENEQRLPGTIETANLLALALHAVGRTQRGLEILRDNLRRGRENGYLRIFVDEGAPLQSLLRRLGRLASPERGVEAEYVRALSALMRQAPLRGSLGLVRAAPATAIDALTTRELAVLRLLAAGLDNHAIALELMIAPATVKVHLNHMYAKLNVTGRRQAVQRAEQLGLLR